MIEKSRVLYMSSQIIKKQIKASEEYRETQIIFVDFCFDLFCCLKKPSTESLEEGFPRFPSTFLCCSFLSLEREALALDPYWGVIEKDSDGSCLNLMGLNRRKSTCSREKLAQLFPSLSSLALYLAIF